jgi:hypothetical protein
VLIKIIKIIGIGNGIKNGTGHGQVHTNGHSIGNGHARAHVTVTVKSPRYHRDRETAPERENDSGRSLKSDITIMFSFNPYHNVVSVTLL